MGTFCFRDAETFKYSFCAFNVEIKSQWGYTSAHILAHFLSFPNPDLAQNIHVR